MEEKDYIEKKMFDEEYSSNLGGCLAAVYRGGNMYTRNNILHIHLNNVISRVLYGCVD